MRKYLIARGALLAMALCALVAGSALAGPRPHDIIIRHGTIYDGTGAQPYVGDVAIDGDHISYVGPHAEGRAVQEIDARGKAVAPGFVNMLSHAEETLLVDGRALSDLRQGVTLEIFGEDSMGPLTPKMKQTMLEAQSDIRYPITWTTLAEYLNGLEKRGIAPNVASTVGLGTVRVNVLGERDIQPTATQLDAMRRLVREAMEGGAVAASTALIYSPNGYARTPELEALATEAGRCGGIYMSHMRSEGDRLIQGVQELIQIAYASGAPAEIYHFKAAGRENWGKLDAVIRMIEAARASGTRITADAYTYTEGATGLDGTVPPWALDGGLEAAIARFRDPATRARVLADMRDPHPSWENLLRYSGAGGIRLISLRSSKLKPLIGKTLQQISAIRGETPEEAVLDLISEDGTRGEATYELASADNLRREISLPWVSFCSDEGAPAPAGVFLHSYTHPRAYGSFARVFAKYVREEHALSVAEAVRRLSGLPAAMLSLSRRGKLAAGYFADVVIFAPGTIEDHATFERPHQLATGVSDVLVNGQFALRDGKSTGLPTGRVVHGRAWTGAPGGGCRASSADWSWAK